RSPLRLPAEERQRRASTTPQRTAVAAVRKFPQGTAPAPRPAVPGGRIQGARAARREPSAKEVRPQPIGVQARAGMPRLSFTLWNPKAREGALSLVAR